MPTRVWSTIRAMMQKSRSVSHWLATRYLMVSGSSMVLLRLR